METKNEKASKILGEINKALGEDNSFELLHILRKQGRVSEKQWEEMAKIQREAINKQRLIRESILDAVKALKIKLPEVFDVNVSNQKDFPGSIKISNLEDIKFPGEVGFKKPLWFADLLAKWVTFPIVKVLGKQLQNVNINGPRDPKKAIAVRLSDGENFYKVVMTAVGAVAASDPLLQGSVKTFTNEFITSLIGDIPLQTIITPPVGKSITVKFINISTESTSGAYALDFLTSGIKVWRYYPGSNSSLWLGAITNLQGAVDEVLKISASGAGNTKRMYIQVGHDFR